MIPYIAGRGLFLVYKNLTTSNVVSSIKFSNTPFSDPELIGYSVLQICYEISDANKIIQSGCGHCCIYSHNGEHSYLALPEHCFPYDSTKQCKVWVKDYEGKKIDLEWTRVFPHSYYDAEILEVKKIFGLPSLCELAVLTSYCASGDSTFIFNPFNVRNVEKKWGTFFNGEKIKMNTMICEPGDSGGLIMSREGVAGIVYSASDNGMTVRYVPILVFEKMYGDLMFNYN
jgi:hypothetical protein